MRMYRISAQTRNERKMSGDGRNERKYEQMSEDKRKGVEETRHPVKKRAQNTCRTTEKRRKNLKNNDVNESSMPESERFLTAVNEKDRVDSGDKDAKRSYK